MAIKDLFSLKKRKEQKVFKDSECDFNLVFKEYPILKNNVKKAFDELKMANDRMVNENFNVDSFGIEVNELHARIKMFFNNSKYAMYQSEEIRLKDITSLRNDIKKVLVDRLNEDNVFKLIFQCLNTIQSQTLRFSKELVKSVDNGNYYYDYYKLDGAIKSELKNVTDDFIIHTKKLNEISQLATETFETKKFKKVEESLAELNSIIMDLTEKFDALDLLWGGALSKYMVDENGNAKKWLNKCKDNLDTLKSNVEFIAFYEVNIPTIKGADRVYDEPPFTQKMFPELYNTR